LKPKGDGLFERLSTWLPIFLGASLLMLHAGCGKGENTNDSQQECLSPDELFESDGAIAPNYRNPIEITDPWMIYTCPDFPENELGLGKVCSSHSDCTGEGQVCTKGIVPCEGAEVGRCTSTCRNDYECSADVIDYESVPELVCTIAQDQLSICLPSTCLASIPGWDTICGPLDGEAVNDLGVGHACDTDADCVGLDAHICPGGDIPERHCTLSCESDADCGPNAACVCVEDNTCTQYFYICAPAKNCAEAVRHHHCRGPGVPPRQHGATCGDHDH